MFLENNSVNYRLDPTDLEIVGDGIEIIKQDDDTQFDKIKRKYKRIVRKAALLLEKGKTSFTDEKDLFEKIDEIVQKEFPYKKGKNLFIFVIISILFFMGVTTALIIALVSKKIDEEEKKIKE